MLQVGKGSASPGPAEGDVAGKKGRGPVRLVEPVSLLGLSLGHGAALMAPATTR